MTERDPASGEPLDPDHGTWPPGETPGDPLDTIWNRPLGQPEPPWPTKSEWEAKRYRYVPYHDYLKTDHWQQARRWILWRAYGRCERCDAGHTQLDVHHRSYQRLGHELREDLEAICRACHEREHGLAL